MIQGGETADLSVTEGRESLLEEEQSLSWMGTGHSLTSFATKSPNILLCFL